MVCPRCGSEMPDYDGLGVVAHVPGCGYCTHPMRTGGRCEICGEPETHEVRALAPASLPRPQPARETPRGTPP